VRADTDEATKALSPATMMEVIKSLSESVKSLSETVKVLSEPSEPAAKADHTPAKESTTTNENKGLSFKGEFDSDFMPLLLDFNLPKLKKSNPLYQVEVQNLALHLNTDTNNSLGLALSNVSFKVGHFKVDTKLLGLKTTLENLDFILKGEILDDVVNYSWQTKLEKLLIPEVNSGKALDLSYESKVDLQRVDAAALLALQTAVHGLSKQFQEGTLTETELDSSLEQKAKELLPQLLAKSPKVTISELQLTSPDGQLQGSATVSIDGEKPISLENEDELQKSLIEALTIQADFSLSKDLLVAGLKLREDNDDEAVAETIQSLLAEKILVEGEDDTYQSTISLEDGKLTINGEVEDLRLNFMKEKVAEAVELLTTLQKPAEEYLAKENSFPEIEKLGGKTSGKYVASIVSEPKQFYFQATLKEASEGIESEIAGKTVKMVFDQENKSWHCEPGEEEGVETQYLPESCQVEEAE
jgi:hypothetical protein